MGTTAPRFLGLALLAFATLSALAPHDARAAEEPVLEGEAKKKHDDDVASCLAELRTEKNKVIVQNHIARIGTSGKRAERDALIVYATGIKNQAWASYAFDALSKIGGARVIEFLSSKHALRSPDFLIAQTAAGALAKTKDPAAAGPLLDVITAPGTKSEVLGAAALAVAQVAPKDERVAETLMGLTKAVKDMTRGFGAEALGYLATDAALARLVEMLSTDKNTGVRVAAAKGLGNTKRADAVPSLEKAIATERAFTVKDAASDAIQKIQGGR